MFSIFSDGSVVYRVQCESGNIASTQGHPNTPLIKQTPDAQKIILSYTNYVAADGTLAFKFIATDSTEVNKVPTTEPVINMKTMYSTFNFESSTLNLVWHECTFYNVLDDATILSERDRLKTKWGF